MPFALLLIGILLVVSGVKGTQGQLGTQIAKDFSGAGSFWYWIIGLGIVGSIGYNANLRGISRLFLVLILLVFVLANHGFFAQLSAALKTIATPAPATVAPAGSAAPTTNAAPSTSPSGILEQLGNPIDWANKAGQLGQDFGTMLHSLGSLF